MHVNRVYRVGNNVQIRVSVWKNEETPRRHPVLRTVHAGDAIPHNSDNDITLYVHTSTFSYFLNTCVCVKINRTRYLLC